MDSFKVEWHPTADWFLQARINQDIDFNITLDQTRYSKSIVRRYLPNAEVDPMDSDRMKYTQVLPRNFKWTKQDCSTGAAETLALEKQYGF
jgi:hypothetical protein